LFLKLFFTRKYINIIFLFYKNYFGYQHIKIIIKNNFKQKKLIFKNIILALKINMHLIIEHPLSLFLLFLDTIFKIK